MIKQLLFNLSTDKALGAVGGSLAVASLGFGIYMNIHGPVASFGHSKDFGIFAQFAAPREARRSTFQVATATHTDDTLDMTSTGSIKDMTSQSAAATSISSSDVIASVTLSDVSADAATIVVDGHPRTVRIGDIVPSAGEVLEIRQGTRPSVKTTLGYILTAR